MEPDDGISQDYVRPIPLAIQLVDAWAAERARALRKPRGTRVELKMCVIARDFSRAKAESTQRLIDRCCLKNCRPRRLYADGSLYSLTLDTASGEPMGALAQRLLERIRIVASEGGCDVEAEIRHRPTGRNWSEG